MLCQLRDKHTRTLADCTSSSAAVRALPGLFSFILAHLAPGQPAAIMNQPCCLQCGMEDCISLLSLGGWSGQGYASDGTTGHLTHMAIPLSQEGPFLTIALCLVKLIVLPLRQPNL